MTSTTPDPATLAPLPDRGLLLVSGPDVTDFLQGMATCNFDNLTDENTLYGAHLSHQGRVLYDFFAFKWPFTLSANSTAIALDCHKQSLMAFAKSLHDHKMRFKIEFEDLSDEYGIYADLSNASDPGKLFVRGNNVTLQDPRLASMGARIFTSEKLSAGKVFEDYETRRIKLGLPDPAYDGKPGKTIVSELCLEYLGGVDYKKGCYMGQEMTARTHFRSPPKKRLVSVAYDGKPPVPGAKVKAGKLPVGEVYSCRDGHGIAIVRVAKALTDDAQLTADGVPLTAKKPAWAEYSIE